MMQKTIEDKYMDSIYIYDSYLIATLKRLYQEWNI